MKNVSPWIKIKQKYLKSKLKEYKSEHHENNKVCVENNEGHTFSSISGRLIVAVSQADKILAVYKISNFNSKVHLCTV